MSSANRPSGEQWGSKIGVILAVAGSAVGLGNFLRFPGKAASYGGGAFMIPYFCALLLLGIPICWIEWTMGRRGGRFGFNSAPGIFSVLWRSPISKYLGTIGLLVPTVIYMYYVYIESWCLLYAVYYAAGSFDSFGSDPYAYSQFFERVTGVKEDGAVFSNGIQPLFWFFLITFVVNFMVIYRGLSKGIETFCKFAMPMLIIAAVIVVVRVLTLPEQPTPAPWQRSLAAALPANEWDGIRERLADPSTTIDGARTIIHDAFETYYDMATEKSDRPTTPVMPPVGFMDTGSGLSIALAELRDPGAAAPFQSWLVEEKGALKDDQKRSLQQLEREQTRLENKGKGRVDFETRLSKIESERDAILLSTQVGPMPVMTSP